MKNPFQIRGVVFGFAVFILLTITQTTYGQLFQDTIAVNLVRQGFDHIYRQEFNDAEEILTRINQIYPGHPATYLYKAIIIYYQEYPLIPSNPRFKAFEYQLRTSIRVCEAKPGWLDDPEKLLIDFCSRGLLMLCYNENGMTNEVISIAFSTYKCVKKSFKYKDVYPDFCYFTGLYNYYREAYPEHHPVYRAIAALFPHGDRQAGLKDLQKAAENGIMLKAEAYSILSWIYMYYEKNYPEALKYSRGISEKFPSNMLFRVELVKNLLLVNNFEEAEKVIPQSGNIHEPYFRGQTALYNAFIQEKKYQNYSQASKLYQEGVNAMKTFGVRGQYLADYGTDGLKRVKALQKSRGPIE